MLEDIRKQDEVIELIEPVISLQLVLTVPEILRTSSPRMRHNRRASATNKVSVMRSRGRVEQPP